MYSKEKTYNTLMHHFLKYNHVMKISRFFNFLESGIGVLSRVIRRSLDFELKLIGDRDIDEILNNGKDRRLIEDTVDEIIKKGFPVEGIEITLSCGNKINLTV